MGLLIGLTGGIASGKSTVAGLLSDAQIPIVDTDQLSRELVEPGTPALMAIVDAFGPSILQPDHQLDRSALRKRILADPHARRLLEEILHPPIRQLAQARARHLAEAHPIVVIVIPLLAEETVFPHYRWLDLIVAVTTTPALQHARLLTRPGIDGQQADQLLQAQVRDDRRRAIADFCLDNSGDLAHLQRQVGALLRELQKRITD